MKTLHYSIIVLVMGGLFIGTNSVYAPCLIGVTSCGPPPGVTVSTGTDSTFYEKNDTINVQGRVYVENYTRPLQIDIVSPNGTIIQSNTIPVTNGTFGEKTSANFDTTGVYQIVTCVQSWCDRSNFKFIAEPYRITVNGGDYFIKYKSSADLVGIEDDTVSDALRVHIASGSGKFVIELPRSLIDSQEYGKDASFKILVGMHQPDKFMQFANFTEIASNNLSRTLAIDIPYEPISNTAGIWDFKISSVEAVSGPGYQPTLKQFKSGVITEYVSCKDGLFLAIKSHDQEPTCLKAGTISKLASRGFLYGVQANENEINYTTILLPPGSENPTLNKTYSPNVATVVIGVNNTVRWVNQGESAHTITPDMPVIQDGNSFGSHVMKPGGSYQFIFTQPGTFPYHGEPGPWEKGTIVVLSYIQMDANHTLSVHSQSQNPFMVDKDGKVDLSQIHLPSNNYGKIDYDKIGYLISENEFKKMLHQLNIGYANSNYLLLQGEELLSYPPFTSYCGYVLDNNQQEHWFSSSFHYDTLTSHKISRNNPEPCKPGFASCFCNLQTKIAENNLKQLSFFTKSEEETIGETVVQYLDKTKVVNVSNEFTVGKYNLQADPSLVHYCGKFTWGEQLQYFDGYIKDSNVVFFELAPEQQKLCAINADAKLFSFEYKENNRGK